MYRKAGIIVGLILVGIALAVVMITNGVRMKASEEPPVDTSVEATESGDSNTSSSQTGTSTQSDVSENNESSGETVTTQPTTPVVSTPVKEDRNIYLEYNEGNLKDLKVSDEITEVMVVSSKKVVLLDPTNSDSYQFVHACEFLTSSNLKLSYFISSSTYDSVEIGEQLRVTYKVYTNANDLDMPVIVKVDRLNSNN